MNGEDHDLAQILEPPALPDGCPTGWTLQRYALDELVGDQREAVAIHVASCARCRLEVAGLDTFREDFLRQRPFASADAEVAERALFLSEESEIEVHHPTWPRLRVALAASLVGAAVLVMAVVFVPSVGTGPAPYDGLKGTTALRAALLRDGEVQRLDGGVEVRPGDVIQFRVDTGSHDHVLVLGMDGTGAVSVYQPLGGGQSVSVDPGAGRTLSPALRLDDAPGPEVYVALFTDEPVASQDAEALVRGWAGEHGARGLAVQAPHTALGGAVEVLLLNKEVR